MATKPEPQADKPQTIFDLHRIKSALINRVMRALKDAPTDEMRKAIIAEVADLNRQFTAPT